ncbi:dependent RNA helicase [Seminavis robusta]|uniref:Dependent RNA helicase n=1 Tax=Seminavis robusta TaxID=568900 RepID=A0A9N8DBG1_9STRA|nr:dependent RNA helicase [Seminavis robusta]|eukprot:Sro72_g039810.1 dependent RNA helicase (590) ;mRNA; r:48804-50668
MSTLFGKSTRKKRARTENADETRRSNQEAELLLVDATHQEEDDAPLTLKKAHNQNATSSQKTLSPWASFSDLGLDSSLVSRCANLGFSRPTAVQRTVIPHLLHNNSQNILALSKTGSGKTAAFVLPIIHHLMQDPYGIFAVILTPTRELAKQIHQQILALGSTQVSSALVIGGLDPVAQSVALDARPHFCVATPGRLAELLRGPNPPRLHLLRFLVLDEADRLLAPGGFERDVAELLLHATNPNCQTLLFSATMTRSLEEIQDIAAGAKGGNNNNNNKPLQKFVIREDTEKTKQKKKKQKTNDNNDETTLEGESQEDSDNDDDDEALTPKIPEGLTQEYIFMPSRVRDAYLLAAIRKLMIHGGRPKALPPPRFRKKGRKGTQDDDDNSLQKARLAIIFVSTCERAALVSCILDEVGVSNVALHSLLSQNRRLAALGKFKSEQVRVLVATDVASRGLDIPTVDLVLNSELPHNTTNYIHRVGRTARAGRRGLAISLVGESDVALVHAAERLSGRPLEKCQSVSDEEAIQMLGPVTKAARLAKMKLNDIGFDDLVQKFKERKVRDRKDRARIERALKRQSAADDKQKSTSS